MAMTIKEIRKKYPDYDDLSDTELADKIHAKFYPDLPKEDVYSKLELTESSIPSIGLQQDEMRIPEKTGVSGVGSDFAHGLANAFRSGRQFIRDVPENLEKSGEYIQEHPATAPLHMLGQLGAETAEIGKDILNAPYNLNQYLARKHLLPQVLGKLGKAIPHIPEDTGVEKALGLEADPEKGDALIRAVPDLAAALTGGASVLRQGKKLFKAPDLKAALKETQSKVNAAAEDLGKTFDKVEQEVVNREISAIPVDKELISQAKRFLDKSPETKALIEAASKGDYKALREVQADLRVIGEEALSNKLSTERKVGREALSVRNRINKGIENHFENTGNSDLADLLRDTRSGYGALQDIYFSSPALAKVFGKSQRIPKNPLTLLTEDSTEMSRFFNAHPEMEAMLKKALTHKSRKKKALGALGILGIGTTGGITSHILNKH